MVKIGSDAVQHRDILFLRPSILQGERKGNSVIVQSSVRGEACLPSVRQVSNHERNAGLTLWEGIHHGEDPRNLLFVRHRCCDFLEHCSVGKKLLLVIFTLLEIDDNAFDLFNDCDDLGVLQGFI